MPETRQSTAQDRMRDAEADIASAMRSIAAKCPRTVSACYWAGTSCIAMEELHHRRSFDVDLHTRRALEDVRPMLNELQRAFPRRVKIVQAPDEFGSGFRVVVTLPGGNKLTVEVLSNHEDVKGGDIVASSLKGWKRVSLKRYLEDKVQCVAERVEARDLVDIWAIVQRHPDLVGALKKSMAGQDAAILAERLLMWTDRAIAKDMKAYKDVDAADAIRARDLMLGVLRNA